MSDFNGYKLNEIKNLFITSESIRRMSEIRGE